MIDVGYITYKDKQYPIRISYYVLKRLKEKTGKELEDSKHDIHLYEQMLYFSLQSGAKYTNTETVFTEEQMEDVLDHCFIEFVNLIPQFFVKTKESDKKKVTKNE